MRKFMFLCLMGLLCLPVLANQEDEGVLPFAYVVEREGTAYDLFVMDARSGNHLYSVVGEDHDCPYDVSEDGNWLSYSHNSGNRRDADTSILNLSTGETVLLGELSGWVLGNRDFSQIAYFRRDDNRDTHLYLHDRSTGDNHLLLEDRGDEIELMRFVGDDLLFVALEENEIIFNRWNGTSLETQSFYRRDSHNLSMDTSPNGNLLKVLYHSNDASDVFVVIDTVTGNTEELVLPQLDIKYLPQLMPGSSNSFAYIGDDEGIWFYDAELGELRQLLAAEETAWYSDLRWSPDASYLLLNQNLEGSYLNLKLITMRSGLVSNIFTGGNVWNVEWLSANEFVYDYSEDRFTTDFDIVYYDASAGEMHQLTNTDDFDESLYCGWG